MFFVSGERSSPLRFVRFRLFGAKSNLARADEGIRPYGLHKFVILSTAKNLTQYRVNLILSRAGKISLLGKTSAEQTKG